MAWLDSIKTLDGMILHTPFPIIENLIDAINERCIGADISTIDDFTKNNYLLHTKTIYSVIQAKITLLISKYINHTDNGGDWTAKQIIPNWTEETIIAEIGDVERLLVPQKLETERAWIFQQYNIINLLRWGRTSVTQSGDREERTGYYFGVGTLLSTYNTALADYNSNSWVLNSLPNHVAIGGTVSVRNLDGGYIVNIFHERVKIKSSTDWTTVIQKSVVLYLYSFVRGPTNPFPRTYEYGNFAPVLPATAEILKKVIELDENNLSNISEMIETNIPSEYADPIVTNKELQTCSAVDFYNGQCVFVLKFDGANGFNFKNW